MRKTEFDPYEVIKKRLAPGETLLFIDKCKNQIVSDVLVIAITLAVCAGFIRLCLMISVTAISVFLAAVLIASWLIALISNGIFNSVFIDLFTHTLVFTDEAIYDIIGKTPIAVQYCYYSELAVLNFNDKRFAAITEPGDYNGRSRRKHKFRREFTKAIKNRLFKRECEAFFSPMVFIPVRARNGRIIAQDIVYKTYRISELRETLSRFKDDAIKSGGTFPPLNYYQSGSGRFKKWLNE